MGTALRSLALVHLDRHPEEAARVLERCSAEDVTAFLSHTEPKVSARLLAVLSPGFASACLDGLPVPAQQAVLAELSPLGAAAILRLRPHRARECLLSGVPVRVAGAIRSALSYPRGSAGAAAAPDALTILDDMTVEEAIESVGARRDRPPDRVVVLSRSRRFRGVLRTPDLCWAPRDTAVGALPLEPVRAVAGTATVARLAADARHDGAFLPVVDRSGAFLGIVGTETLRGAARRTSVGQATDFVAAFSELCWFALTGLMAALADGFLSPSTAARAGRRLV